MTGIGGLALGIEFPKPALCSDLKPEVADRPPPPSKKEFHERFAADSAEAGVVRTLQEQAKQAKRLYSEKNFHEAVEAYEQMAHCAKELGDKASEAIAVLGIADCLGNLDADTADVELICGMYRYAGDAADDAGDANLKFLALTGCAQIRRSCRMFQRSEKLWEIAVDTAVATENWEHSAFAKSQLANTLLQDPDEANLEVVDESKNTAGHVSRHAGTTQLRSGSSPKFEQALKLLEEVVTELPESASTAQQVSARVNFATLLRTKTNTQSKKRAEQEFVSALECLAAAGGDPEAQMKVEASLLELYEENAWILHNRPDAQARKASLKAKQEALRGTLEQIITDVGKPTDPEERHIYERASWANQKLEAMRRGSDEDDSDSDVDVQPARPLGNGWQR